MLEYKMPYREENSNKGTFGKVLNVSGSKNYVGAAYLSSLSVLKAGAGYVALASEKDIINKVLIMLPDAVYYTHNDGYNNLHNFNVLLIGCGLGNNNFSKKVFDKFIKMACKLNIPTVIDADGLNILSEHKMYNLPQNTILTPHPKEAARLLSLSTEEVLSDLEASAKDISKKYNCVTVLKTHRTIICDKDNLFINTHGNSALSKAGSGDVLTGIISGLIAQKMSLFEAAKLGVYLHSRTGEIASEELTEYSVLASDLPKYLHKAIREII